MKRITVAVVGAGYWGPNIVRNFLKIPNVQIKYLCDIDRKKLTTFSSQYPNIIPTEDFQEILNDKKVDVVTIATPVSTHYDLAKRTLESNKHVIVEKPMTSTSDEANQLISLAIKQRKKLMVGHTFVYSEAVKKIFTYIRTRKLGKLYYYDSTRINLGLIQQDTNVIWDLAPHDLSILNYIFDAKPLSVQAFGSSYTNKKIEEVAHIIIKYEKNIHAHIHLSWLSPVKIRSILIGGSKKMVVYNDIEPSEKVRLYDKGVVIPTSKITPFAPAYRSGDVIIPRLEQTEALYNQLLHFVDCIVHDKKPLTDGTAGRDVVVLLEKINQALRSKKEVLLK
jgi:predicted dehydrogenase